MLNADGEVLYEYDVLYEYNYRNEKLFDANDLADWELHFETGLAALDIPELKPYCPEFCKVFVLDDCG